MAEEFEFKEALARWLLNEEDLAYRKLRKPDSDERTCDRARGALDVIEKLHRAVEDPRAEFGQFLSLDEGAEEEDEDARAE